MSGFDRTPLRSLGAYVAAVRCIGLYLALGCSSRSPPIPPNRVTILEAAAPAVPSTPAPSDTLKPPVTESAPALPVDAGTPTGASAACVGRDRPLEEKILELRGDSRWIPAVQLGAGLELEFDYSSTVVRRGRRRAPGPPVPRPPGHEEPLSIKRVRECSDGTLLLIYDGRREVRTRVAELEARLENAAAMVLHRQGRFMEAAEGFRRAVALAPELEVAATNLASALTRLDRKNDAVAALRPLLARTPIRLYAKLCQDSELSPLLDEPEIARLRAPRPGSGRIGPYKEQDDY